MDTSALIQAAQAILHLPDVVEVEVRYSDGRSNTYYKRIEWTESAPDTGEYDDDRR